MVMVMAIVTVMLMLMTVAMLRDTMQFRHHPQDVEQRQGSEGHIGGQQLALGRQPRAWKKGPRDILPSLDTRDAAQAKQRCHLNWCQKTIRSAIAKMQRNKVARVATPDGDLLGLCGP